MKSKQIIIDYNDYLYMEEQLKELLEIIRIIYFRHKINIDTKRLIESANKKYIWWV